MELAHSNEIKANSKKERSRHKALETSLADDLQKERDQAVKDRMSLQKTSSALKSEQEWSQTLADIGERILNKDATAFAHLGEAVKQHKQVHKLVYQKPKKPKMEM